MTRPQPKPKQVWRSKNYEANKRVVHLYSVDYNSKPIQCYYDSYKEQEKVGTGRMQIKSLRDGYWFVSHHWSGDNLALLAYESMSELRGY